MATMPGREDPRLIPVLSGDRVWTGVTTTTSGRLFVSYPSTDGPGVQVAEALTGGRFAPYPDARWNEVRAEHDPRGRFVHVNALRVGPDGQLWIVDAGAAGLGQPQVPGGARLISVDLDRDQVHRSYDLGPATYEHSYIDDVRFNGRLAYVSDSGAAGLIVVDLDSGRSRRVLDNHPATVNQGPLYADGQVLRDAHGAELRVHCDQIEVSPDGRYLYFQPLSGPMSRVETRYLDNPATSAQRLGDQVQHWADTPTTGGTAIDAAGTIYLSDVENRRLLTIAPDRRMSPFLTDPRLVWCDALWIDSRRHLWMPAAQLNRTAGLTGAAAVEYPVHIYKAPIDVGPAPNDHA
ncbi:major royal jelly protein [Micromonospora sp. L5]|uniref:Uncharacterized protein n=1 Tax=Micromonospora aurantiaca (nom. illeg.) TaxID=47850 RepID=A0A3M9K9W0_9ACTN|nr:major royal jelly protein [Micromonospora sp. L5]AXH93483.1 hypothetical protein DVH21_28065 [Micromonospora aurantiaca]OHX07069.1 hypothetical protein BFV98_31010 [Micromonospora sp. WMMB235]RNH97830.1 hypothetical protein EEZ25_29055 [Micromonospora aurantiaca]